jgi:hypothetical protein
MDSDGARGSGEECAMNALRSSLAVSMAAPIAMGLGYDAARTEGIGEGQAREIGMSDLGFGEIRTRSREHTAIWERRFQH